MLSFSEENYIKAIYHLQTEKKTVVNTNLLSKHLSHKASSVTDMLRKLSEKSLVVYKKYHGVRLSKAGKNVALRIIRKHRLWEFFLVNKLNFNWDEVHDIAEQLEHIQSEKLTDELDKFLNYPKRDPHGDPIPDKDGEFQVLNKKTLAELDLGQKGICIGVKDTTPSFLSYLDKQGIALGKEIKVMDKEEFDNSMKITYDDKQINISQNIAKNLFIKQ